MPRVLITSGILSGVDGPWEKLLGEAGFEVVPSRWPRQLTESELLDVIGGADAIVAGAEPYTRRVIEANPQLRVVARTGVGYDAVDLAAATKQGVAVTITPGTNHESVAEHAFALMLALARSIVPQTTGIRGGTWRRDASAQLRGQTLGLVGLGRIGRAVAVRAKAFGMNVIAFEPNPDAEFVAQHEVSLVPLERLLSEADFVSLHLPFSKESQNLIDDRTLRLMKPTAFLINTARGGVVCEESLVRALEERRLAGAGLDVFAKEPVYPDNPLLRFDNVLCTAHTAGIDLQARDDMAMMAARSIVALFRGDWTHAGIVNPGCREHARWRQGGEFVDGRSWIVDGGRAARNASRTD